MILETGRIWLRAISQTSSGSLSDRRRSRRWSTSQALEPLETRNLLSMVTGPQVLEGDTGERYAMFKVVLAQAPDRPLQYSITTGGGIATPQTSGTANADYVPPTQKTLDFPAGTRVQTLSVRIIGDRLVEHNENFFLVVRGYGQIAVGEAIIIDDDPNLGPPLHVNNPVVFEGNPVVPPPTTPPVVMIPAPTTLASHDETLPIPSRHTLRRLRGPMLTSLAAWRAARLRPSLQ